MEVDPLRMLALLQPAMAAESLEDVGQRAVGAVGDSARAHCVGLFLVLHGNLFKEYWHRGENMPGRELRDRVRRLALAAAELTQRTAPVPPLELPLVPYVHVNPLKERVTAVICAFFDPADRNQPAACELISQLGDLIAVRFSHLLELEAERRRSGQYERWFRRGDKQIRALDLERQKFSALVNALEAVVFVTDEAHTIRWTSRRLLDQCPAPGGRTSWVGQPCDVLCRHLGSACPLMGTPCIASRVHRTRTTERAELAPTSSPLQLTALPLADLEGATQEVMVILERRRAEEREAA